MANERTIAQQQNTVMPMFVLARCGLLQRKCACGQHATAGGECAACRKKRLALQRRATNKSEPATVPPIVHEVLRSPGQSLDPDTRTFMEVRFGHDFSQVRVHTDAKAAESARAVNAMAYTAGQDVVFSAGQYTPRTNAGQRLLAHELTHVVQQGGVSQVLQSQIIMDTPDDRFEAEADQASERTMGEPSSPDEDFSEMVPEDFLLAKEQVTTRLPAISQIGGLMHMQRRCAKAPPASPYPVDVNLDIPATPPPDHSHGTAWISSRAGDPSGLTTGITDGNLRMRSSFDFWTRGSQSWVTKVQVWFHTPQIRIFISSALPAGSCEFTDVLRHERKHDSDYRANAADAETSICNSATAWPSATHPLPASVLSQSDLEIQMNDWMEIELWRFKYENWLDECAWDVVDYPRLYAGCPGTGWTAPAAECPAPPSRPATTVFPLPSR
jgi:hypothetical protein